MKLRQIVLAASDLEGVVEDIQAVLGLEIAHRDPAVAAFGLQNAVFPVGSGFLEVVSPVEPGTAAGRFIERRGGDGGYMIMLQTDDFVAARQRLEAAGASIVFSVDLDDIVEVHVHPRDLPGAIVAVSQPEPAEAWRWGGPHAAAHVRTTVVEAIVGATFESACPPDLAARYAEVLGLGRGAARGWEQVLELDGARLRFVPLAELARDGVIAYELRARDPDRALAAARARRLSIRQGGDTPAVKIGGTWFRLRT